MNTELATKVFNHIVNNPEEWNQSSYYCGAAACFAGHTCIIAGLVNRSELGSLKEFKGKFFINRLKQIFSNNDEYRSIREEAADLLSLALNDADTLFYGHNDIYDIKDILITFGCNKEDLIIP